MPETRRFWNQLLGFLETGNVIPVVGEELLSVDLDGRQGLLYPHLAGALADYLEVPAAELPAEPSLNDVACHYLRQRDARRDDIYSALMWIMGRQQLAVPEPLAQLAEIRRFKLFVSTTFDPLLARALDQVHGKAATQVLSYSPGRTADLPPLWQSGRWPPRDRSPTLFHLLGRLSIEPSYAVTEEDTLEFVHSLQSESRRPNILLDWLDKSHLLILGCRFENWLARFFLRTTVRERLWVAAGIDYLADARALRDPRLVRFLRAFSSRTKLYEGGAIEFVAELHRRWMAIHPSGDLEDEPEAAGEPTEEELPENPDVFLSYAREDFDTARNLADALAAAGLRVWLDRRRIGWGEPWRAKIQRAIEGCSFFLPLISRYNLTDEKRFFRFEWDLAETEARRVKASARFLLPVFLDQQVSPQNSDIPEAFRQAHWRSGEDLDALAAEVRQLAGKSGAT